MKKLFKWNLKLGFWVRSYEIAIAVLVLAFASPDIQSIFLGIFLSSIGVFFRVWSSGYFKRKTDLEVFGPYRFVRHPHDLGTFLLLLGFCLASRSFPLTFLMLIGSFLIFWQIFREEELIMGNQLGIDYRDYRFRVPTIIPNLLPYNGVLLAKKKFSFSRAFFTGRRRHEFESIVAGILVYLILYAFTQIPAVRSWQTMVGILGLAYGLISLGIYARRRKIVTAESI